MSARPIVVRALTAAIVTLACSQIAAIAMLGPRATVLDLIAAEGEPTPAPSASTTSTTSTGDSPPSVAAQIDGIEGNGGWYVGDVILTWTVADAETAVTSTDGCDPVTVNTDTSGDTFACTATSDGGTTTTTATIARDATAPADVAAAADRAPDAGGTYNRAFTVTWSGADATSGIAACTTTIYEGPDTAAGSLDGVCTDAAGNESAPVAFAFAYDATAPVVTGVADRAPDHDGWYTAVVTITWTADDPGATCDEPSSYAGPDAAGVMLTGSCTDGAGNVGTGTFTLSYDATAPTIGLVTPADGAIYLLREPVAADYGCADATAGLASCTGTVADGAPIDTATVGTKTFEVRATDAAGHETVAAVTYLVQYAQGTPCRGGPSHEILEPIAADGSAEVRRNSTVPAKFRVCDYAGVPVASPGVVESFRITSVDGLAVDHAVPSTSAHEQFRTGNGLWTYQISTKSLQPGSSYGFTIGLDDGTSIDFGFRVG